MTLARAAADHERVIVDWRRVARELAVLLTFVAFTVVLTWPLAKYPDRAISDPGDPFFTTWAIDWDYHATFSRASLFDANIFSPARSTLAFSEHMYGIAVLLFPLLAFGVAPLTAHNLAMLAGFVGCGYAMYRLSRHLTGSTIASVVGGLAFAFVGFRFHHIPHLHFVWSLWLPVLLLGVLLLAERPTLRRACLIALAIVLNGLTSLHWLVFGVAALFASAIAISVARRRWDTRFWLLLGGAVFAAGVVLAPFLWPYHVVTVANGMERHFADVYPNSAEWRDWFRAYYKSALFGQWTPDEVFGHERTLFPGFTVLLLAIGAVIGHFTQRSPTQRVPTSVLRAIDACVIVAAVATAAGVMIGDVELTLGGHRLLRYSGSSTAALVLFALVVFRWWVAPRKWRTAEEGRTVIAIAAAISWVAVGVLGSRGLRGYFHSALFALLEPFRGIRMPVRWAMIAYVGLALLASYGAATLLKGRSRTARIAIGLLLVIAVMAESWITPIRWYLVPVQEPRPVYEWLARTPIRGAVLELPLDQWFTYEYLWRSTTHHRPLINGVSSYTPAHYTRIVELAGADPIPDELYEVLERAGCSLIVVHEAFLRARGAAVRDWLARGARAGRITFVRRFNEGATIDYVFALNAVEPAAGRWREPETPDPAGRTPSQNAAIFLDGGGATYASDVIRVDVHPQGVIRGKLVIAGWALASEEIQSINILFGNGRHRFPATRFARPDVRDALPWHPDTTRAGFRREFDNPPGSINGDADMIVEIVTASGKVQHSRPELFTWRRNSPSVPVWKEDALSLLLVRLGAPPFAHDRIREGGGAIHDFVDPLLTEPDREPNVVFAARVVMTLLGRDDAHLRERGWRALEHGVSRRRVIHRVLESRAFAEQYLLRGAVSLD